MFIPIGGTIVGTGLPYGLNRWGVVVEDRGAFPVEEVDGSDEVEEEDGDGTCIFWKFFGFMNSIFEMEFVFFIEPKLLLWYNFNYKTTYDLFGEHMDKQRKNKMTKDTIPEGFSVPLAVFDLIPVIFFGLSAIRE